MPVFVAAILRAGLAALGWWVGGIGLQLLGLPPTTDEEMAVFFAVLFIYPWSMSGLRKEYEFYLKMCK